MSRNSERQDFLFLLWSSLIFPIGAIAGFSYFIPDFEIPYYINLLLLYGIGVVGSAFAHALFEVPGQSKIKSSVWQIALLWPLMFIYGIFIIISKL